MEKKMENITLEDVKNMKFDPPLNELDIFIGISARAQRERERERKAIEEEEEGKILIFPTQEPLGENPIDISRDERIENEKSLFKKPADKGKQVMVEGNLAFDERERLKEMREKSVLRRGGSWCGTRGERVMGGKTTLIKNPAGTTAGKKMKVMPRDLTKEDTKDLKSKPYSSSFDFDLLVDIGMKSRKLYKEEAKKLMISQSESESESEEEEDQEEEEPSNEDHTPIFPSLVDISEKQNKRSLINNAYVEEGKEKFSTSPRGEEDFCCPTPEAAAKRQRMLMRENCLYIPSSSSTSLDISKGERLMAEKSRKKPAVIDENPKRGFVNKQSWFESNNKGIIIEEAEGAFRVMKRTKTSNNKGIKKWVNDSSLDDYKPDLPEFIMDKIRNENGSDVKLVIQKKLTLTDLESGQNRISLPFSALNRTDFLTTREQEYLNGRRTDAEGKISENAEQRRKKKERRPDRNKNGIHVVFIEPNGDRNLELVFKRWDMPKNGGRNVSSMYLFNGKWKDVYKKHDLDPCTIVQVWSFRYNGGELGFAMVIVGRVGNANSNRNRNRNKRNGNGHGHGSNESGSGNGNGSGMGGNLEW